MANSIEARKINNGEYLFAPAIFSKHLKQYVAIDHFVELPLPSLHTYRHDFDVFLCEDRPLAGYAFGEGVVYAFRNGTSEAPEVYDMLGRGMTVDEIITYVKFYYNLG